MFGYEFAVLRPALQPAVLGQSKHFGEPQSATNIFEAHTEIRECAARCPAAAIAPRLSKQNKLFRRSELQNARSSERGMHKQRDLVEMFSEHLYGQAKLLHTVEV